MQRYYKAEMDLKLKITTLVVWLVLALPPVSLAAQWYFSDSRPGTVSPLLVIGGVSLLMAAIAYIIKSMAPRGFALSDVDLVIDRAMRPITIPLSAVTETRLLKDEEVKWTLRTMGASGFYGHYGWFWNRKLGKFRLYSCRFKDLVLVRAGKTTFVLGPEDPNGFVTELGRLKLN